MRRNLILCCVLALSLLGGWLTLISQAAAAASITVTTTNDVIAADEQCSLREAIIAANSDNPFSDCPGGSGNDTIIFSPDLPTPATFHLTSTGSGEDSSLTGDLDIYGSTTNTLAINGLGSANTIIDGDGADRIFDIHPGARATVTGIKVQNGNPGATADGGGIAVRLTSRLTMNSSVVISNTAVSGGGVHVLGFLTLNESTIEANSGGGVHNTSGLLFFTNAQILNNSNGYGIHNEVQGTLRFTGGVVQGNVGGGILNSGSTTTLSGLEVKSNTIAGGLHNKGQSSTTRMTLTDSLLLSNSGVSGAGILNEGLHAIAAIENSRISYNTASVGGGGINNTGSMTLKNTILDHNQANSGGGIDHGGFSLHMTNVTISSNSVGDNGGGLYNRSSANLSNVTLNGNSAGGPNNGGNIFNDNELTLVNTIVANPGQGGNCRNNVAVDISAGHNLDSENSCGFIATGDITNTNPLLGSLSDNGGPTFTHSLLPGSPAIDSGDGSACPATDQRGIDRPQASGCDIGAYEFAATADLSAGLQRVGAGSIASGQAITLTITITNAGPTSPITATVVNTWSPSAAVVAASAGGCSVSLVAGTATCGESNLGLSSTDLTVILTTNSTFSGTLTSVAQVSPDDGVIDATPGNDNSEPVIVSVIAPPSYGVKLSGDESKSGTAGQSVNYTVQITNMGNVADTYDLAVTGHTWISTPSPITVTLAPGAATAFSVLVDIPPGVLGGDSDLVTVTAASHKDGDKSDAALLTTTVPVLYSLEISPDQAQSATAGEQVIYTLTLTNTGNFTDTFSLAKSGASWPVNLSTSTLPLGPGASGLFSLTVDIPHDALGDEGDVAAITAASQGNPAKSRTGHLTTTVTPFYGVTISSDESRSIIPGSSVTYTLYITNTGNMADTFSLGITGDSWATTISASAIPLIVGASSAFTVNVTVPPGTAAGEGDLIAISATSQGNVTESATVHLNTTALLDYNINLSASDAQVGSAGVTVTYALHITNTGNVSDTFDLQATGHSWPSTLSTFSMTLDAAASTIFTVTVDIPADALGGDADSTTITATSRGDGTKSDSALLATSIDSGFGVELSTDSSLTGQAGDTVTYTLHITNTGIVSDTFDLVATGHSWPSTLSTFSMTLNAAASAIFTVTVNIPAGALGGDADSTTITATSRGDGAKSATTILSTNVISVYGIDLSGDDSLTGYPGRIVTYTMWITNSGNSPDMVDIEASGNGWQTVLSTPSLALAVGERSSFTISVSIPSDTTDLENDKVTITARSKHDAKIENTASLTTINRSLPEKIFLPVFILG